MFARSVLNPNTISTDFLSTYVALFCRWFDIHKTNLDFSFNVLKSRMWPQVVWRLFFYHKQSKVHLLTSLCFSVDPVLWSIDLGLWELFDALLLFCRALLKATLQAGDAFIEGTREVDISTSPGITLCEWDVTEPGRRTSTLLPSKMDVPWPSMFDN